VTDQTVFDYIEHLTAKVPQILTVERTTESKYQFLLLVQAVKKKLRVKPTFITFEARKNFSERVKGMLEEYSLFREMTPTDQLYVLEGFAGSFVARLDLPPGIYVIAEVDDGQLKTEGFGRAYNKRRDILKALTITVDTPRILAPGSTGKFNLSYSLRELVKLDWSGVSRFEDFEPVLRKAQVMGWTEEEIGKSLETSDRGNLLTLIKRSDLKPVFDMIEKRGYLQIYSQLIQNLAEVIHYRSLRLMGLDEARVKREMDLRDWRANELEEVAKMITAEDLRLMAERVVKLDPLVQKLGPIGLQILILNSPIRVKR
jgi:hypothetical protein